MDILERIVARKRIRLEALETRVSLRELYRQCEIKGERKNWPLSTAEFQVIAEVKRASPSLGLIPWNLNLEELVRAYKEGGAGVISVLTEEDFFQGSAKDLQTVKSLTNLPLLRKDFIISPYQILDSYQIGASAILLIASLLDLKTLTQFINLTHDLGLEALVECRDEAEIEKALTAGASTIGINNRDLRMFEVRLERTCELAELVPPEIILVSESGIKTVEDIAKVAKAGANAVLVGESFLRQTKPDDYIRSLLDKGREYQQIKGRQRRYESKNLRS